jgi:NTE family protein
MPRTTPPAPRAASRSPSRATPRSSRPARKSRLRIDLALQGGGSHGAFTWGVLDRLLEDERLEIAGISGASAGAMNAVAVAGGLMEGGRAGARTALNRFWTRVADASPFNRLDDGPLGAIFGPNNPWMKPWIAPLQQLGQYLGSQLSPYQLNPLNLNPLRDILADTVDFEAVRACNLTQLFIAATQVATGELRIFRQSELTADMVLASASLPLLFQAVEIDGQAYWDGGYAGNPVLMPLIGETDADDLLLVQINPRERTELPTQAADILERINEITFNASLLKELRSIALLRQLIADEDQPAHHYRNPLFGRVEALRLHLIDGGALLAPLGAGSKTQTSASFLNELHDMGYAAADRWWHRHRRDLGVRSSYEIEQMLAPQRP